MKNPQYRFVIAFENEAKCIIAFYKLNTVKNNHNFFKCYKNKDNSIWLVVTGIGNINAAAGTTYLKMISTNDKGSIWINIGVAGHHNAYPGTIYNIKKIINSLDKKEIYYTNAVINEEIECAVACNVISEERIFKKKNYVYEMEALGFMKTVEKFCYRELICVIKIISDNSNKIPNSYKVVSNLVIEKSLYKINKLLCRYSELSKRIYNYNENLIDLIENRFHLTFSNREKLKKIMPKILVLVEKKIIISNIKYAKNLRDLIDTFEKIISNTKLIV